MHFIKEGNVAQVRLLVEKGTLVESVIDESVGQHAYETSKLLLKNYAGMGPTACSKFSRTSSSG
jgi:hypothetical protein